MSLKWEKDGTAKCGPCEVEIQENGKGLYVFGVDMSGSIYWSDDNLGLEFDNMKSCKHAAETWLRKQVAAMLRDLSTPPTGE